MISRGIKEEIIKALKRLNPNVDVRDVCVFGGIGAAGYGIGFALVAAEPGFQDTVKLIFGYDPGTKQLIGMTVLESKETPGLGDKIEKDAAFVGQFREARAPLVAVKKGKLGHIFRKE